MYLWICWWALLFSLKNYCWIIILTPLASRSRNFQTALSILSKSPNTLNSYVFYDREMQVSIQGKRVKKNWMKIVKYRACYSNFQSLHKNNYVSGSNVFILRHSNANIMLLKIITFSNNERRYLANNLKNLYRSKNRFSTNVVHIR